MNMPDRDTIFNFLDHLRDSGITNMFGAVPYIREAFDIERDKAREILIEWMNQYEG